MTWLKKVLDVANRQFEQLPEWKKYSADRFLRESYVNKNCEKGAVMEAKIPEELTDKEEISIWQEQFEKTGERYEKKIERVESELAEAKAMIERQRDLIRHIRSELFEFDVNLINEEGYAALAEDSGSVARLETYDQMRAAIERLSAPVSDEEWDRIDWYNYARFDFDKMLAARAQKGQADGRN